MDNWGEEIQGLAEGSYAAQFGGSLTDAYFRAGKSGGEQEKRILLQEKNEEGRLLSSLRQKDGAQNYWSGGLAIVGALPSVV